MAKWDRSGYIAAWEAEAGRLRDAAADADLTSPVPSCPDWTLRDLLTHMAKVYGRISRRLLSEDPPDADSEAAAAAEVSDVPVLEELDAARGELAAVLGRMSLDDPAWNFAPQANTARFWFRRAACETAVHRWDAQMTVGNVEPVDAALASEGVDEALGALVPSGRRREESKATGVAQLTARDADRRWFVRLRDDRVALLDAASVDTDVLAVQAHAAGAASDLFLALWGRVPFGVLDVAGDQKLLDALRTR
ncbi:MAG: maleylpyruvate isomerase N-terminal domain-containing protein [Stackebrandtia sp.]